MGAWSSFKQRYRTYDLLLVDDIQFIEGKERLQEEFFHTFNSLYEAGKQIVLSSDRPPHELATLEARLRSRFRVGLITDVQPPDLETRIAILRKKVMTEGLRSPTRGADLHRRPRCHQHPRAGGRADTRRRLRIADGPADLAEVAEEVLRDLFPQGATRPITIEQIQGAVSELFHVSIAELRGDRRQQSIAYPRHIAMYLCRELTDASLPKIGAKFGGRDHSTVLHGVNKIARLLKEDREAFNVVQELTTRDQAGALIEHVGSLWSDRNVPPRSTAAATAPPSLGIAGTDHPDLRQHRATASGTASRRFSALSTPPTPITSFNLNSR